mmetsp:Transcript_85508/g.189988  ORF Transcript_85508/g.189988 Transcript_85508/m.189988 type:complete len:290 (+) Transcript_85508:106-975(+)
MSDLRQRRGEKDESALLDDLVRASKGGGEVDPAEVQVTQEMLMEQVSKWIDNCKEEAPAPGLCNAEKTCKDELAEDPYNLTKMFALGQEYGKARHWDQCANVLIRGWKRVDEFKTTEERRDFLWCLAEASANCKKYQQALAVMGDVDEQAMEKDELRLFLMLKCQVLAGCNDKAGVLWAFGRLIDGLDLQEAARVWIFLCPDLKKVDVIEITRSTLDMQFPSDEDRKLLSLMQSLGDLREDAIKLKEREMQPETWKRNFLWYGMLGVIVVMLLSLYYLEQESLKLLAKR